MASYTRVLWFLPLAALALAGLAIGAQAVLAPGPDNFGYKEQAVPFVWDDIGQSPDAEKVTECNELYYDGTAERKLPFNFKYYGQTYDKIWINENGIVTFAAPAQLCWPWMFIPNNPGPTPGATQPDNMIAPFWANLGSYNYGNDWYNYDGSTYFNDIYTLTRGTSPDREYIIQWTAMDYWGQMTCNPPNCVPPQSWASPILDSDIATFQLRLYECSSSLSYHILEGSIPADGNPSANIAIGQENAAGSDGIQYYFGAGQTFNSGSFEVWRNRCPNPAADSFTVLEDSSANVLDVMANDSDPDGDKFSILSITQPKYGTAVLSGKSPNQVLTYTPFANDNSAWHGVDSFTYRLIDSKGDSRNGNVEVTVTPVNDPPTYKILGLSYGTEGDAGGDIPGLIYGINFGPTPDEAASQSLVFTLLPDRTDVFTTGPDLDSTGRLTFGLQPNANGDVRFTVFATDDGGTANGGNNVGPTRSTMLRVLAVNDAPSFTAGGDISVQEDAANSGSSFSGWAKDMVPGPADATDEANQFLDFDVLNVPDGIFQTLPAVSATGTLSFVTKPDACTPAPLDLGVVLRDDGGYVRGGVDYSPTLPLKLTVSCVNDPPEPVDDDGSVLRDNSLDVQVLANDVDRDGDVLKVKETDSTRVQLMDGGKYVRYTPPAGWSGLETIVYTVEDEAGATADAVLRISVECDTLKAFADTYSTLEDGPFSVGAPGFRTGDLGGVTSRIVKEPMGSLSASGNGGFSYTPPANFHGTDTFLYELDDGIGCRSTAPVRITVVAVNDPPAAMDDALVTPEDQVLDPAPVLDNDSGGVDGAEVLRVKSATGASKGTLEVRDGRLIYRPLPQLHGQDQFTYTVEDESGATAAATAFVTITPVMDVPLARPDSFRTLPGATLAVQAGDGVLANDEDPDWPMLDGSRPPLRADVQEHPTHGTLALSASGALTYTPVAGYRGPDWFLYQVTNSRGGHTGGVEVHILVGGGPPTADFEVPSASAAIGIPLQFIDRSDDPEGDMREWAWSFGDGERSSAASPVYTYTEAGEYTVRLTVTDGDGFSASASKTFVVLTALGGGGDAEGLLAPIVDAGQDLVVAPNDPVRLRATANKAVTWSWQQVGGPEAVLANADTAEPSFTAPGLDGVTAVELRFQVTVFDGQMQSSPDEVAVRVVAAGAPVPVLEAGADRDVLPGERVTVAAHAQNLQDSSLLWSPAAGPFVVLTPVGDAIELQVPDMPGQAIRLKVESLGSAALSDEVVLRIVPAQGFSFERVEGQSSRVIFRSHVPGAQSWDFGDEATSTGLDPSHRFAQSGTYQVTLRVQAAAGEMTFVQEVRVHDGKARGVASLHEASPMLALVIGGTILASAAAATAIALWRKD